MVSTHLKNNSQNGSFPQVRVKQKSLKPPPAEIIFETPFIAFFAENMSWQKSNFFEFQRLPFLKVISLGLLVLKSICYFYTRIFRICSFAFSYLFSYWTVGRLQRTWKYYASSQGFFVFFVCWLLYEAAHRPLNDANQRTKKTTGNHLRLSMHGKKTTTISSIVMIIL